MIRHDKCAIWEQMVDHLQRKNEELEKEVDILNEEVQKKEELIKDLRSSLSDLVHLCRDYAITEESLVIALGVEKASESLDRT